MQVREFAALVGAALPAVAATASSTTGAVSSSAGGGAPAPAAAASPAIANNTFAVVFNSRTSADAAHALDRGAVVRALAGAAGAGWCVRLTDPRTAILFSTFAGEGGRVAASLSVVPGALLGYKSSTAMLRVRAAEREGVRGGTRARKRAREETSAAAAAAAGAAAAGGAGAAAAVRCAGGEDGGVGGGGRKAARVDASGTSAPTEAPQAAT